MISGAMVVFVLAQGATPQFSQRGFIETRGIVYPQTAPNDSGHVVGDALLRWEGAYKPKSWLTFDGSFDARTDTHHQVAREWDLDVDGRETQRPALSMRRMSATFHRGKFTTEIGRQFIRWGKADILNPTDRFAPKDFLSSVVDTDFLGVNAVRTTYEAGSNTIDAVWQPWFTPSRTPLVNQRWAQVPAQVADFSIKDNGACYPGGSQYGVRWNHLARAFEYSLSYFEGRQNLPSFDATLVPSLQPTIAVQRYYPQLRLYGGDAAVPLTWFTVKGEAAYLTSSTPGAEEYVLYVLQVERFVREWTFVGGYAGSHTTRAPASPLQFAPDRGIAKSFIGRAGYTITRTVAGR